MKKTTQLRQLINSDEIVICPGVYDGLSARLVERAGFNAVYASGGGIARSSGLPDLGLLSFTEVLARLEQIVDATHLPVIADADTGYGNELNVRRTVRKYQQIGVAGLHLEDQEAPKRCGHLNDKKLIPVEEMVKKIEAAKQALHDPDFLIIARTDAIAVEGFEHAIARGKAYAAAGADVLFIEAPETIEHIEHIAKKITTPKLINMFPGGKTPLLPAQRLQELGYRIIIIPSDLQCAAIYAMEKTLEAIKRDGDSHAVTDQRVSFKQREIIIRTEEFLQGRD